MRCFLLVTAALLSAATAHAKLEICDVEACEGRFGPARKSLGYVPGDSVQFRFVLAGLDVDRDGRITGDMTISLLGPGGEGLLEQSTRIEAMPPLGGRTVPGQATITLPGVMPAGRYTMGVAVRQKRSTGEASFRRELTILPAGFAAVRPGFFLDPEGKIPGPAGGVVGQTLFVRIRAVGFDRSTSRIDTLMRLQLFDEAGTPLMSRPLEDHEAADDPGVARKAESVDFDANFTLNRPGTYLMRVTLSDRIGGKMATYEAPIKVANP
jgi:hypothetical protein